jgi:hypothetical protein
MFQGCQPHFPRESAPLFIHEDWEEVESDIKTKEEVDELKSETQKEQSPREKLERWCEVFGQETKVMYKNGKEKLRWYFKDITEAEMKRFAKVWHCQVDRAYALGQRLTEKVEQYLYTEDQVQPEAYRTVSSCMATLKGIIEEAILQIIEIFEKIGVSTAFTRVIQVFGSLDNFLHLSQMRDFSKMQTSDWAIIGACLGGGAGLGAAVASLLGILLTGFGALFLVLGTLVGGVGARCYYRYRKDKIEDLKSQFRRHQTEYESFFGRWEKLGDLLYLEDFRQMHSLAVQSQKHSHIFVCRSFPELSGECPICLERFVCHGSQVRLTPLFSVTQSTKKPEKGDVVYSDQCELPHFVHFSCDEKFRSLNPTANREKSRTCIICNTKVEKWLTLCHVRAQALYDVPLGSSSSSAQMIVRATHTSKKTLQPKAHSY